MFLTLIASITKSSPRVTGESTTVTTRIHFMWSSLSSSPFSNCWFKVSSSMLSLDRVTKTTLQKVKISLGYFKHRVPNGLFYFKKCEYSNSHNSWDIHFQFQPIQSTSPRCCSTRPKSGFSMSSFLYLPSSLSAWVLPSKKKCQTTLERRILVEWEYSFTCF